MQIEKWGMFEVSVIGPKDGNPFKDHWVKGNFISEKENVTVDGFYDGNGVYKVRFMPSFEGTYTYKVKADFLEEEKSEGSAKEVCTERKVCDEDACTEVCGEFTVTEPSAGNHGPVKVANKFHLAYADGTPHYSVGTTCYVWNTQPDEVLEETLKELEKMQVNKIRFCVFPKHFNFNLVEPVSYPYEGTPCDSSMLDEINFHDYDQRDNGSKWDFYRFNSEHFQRVEYCITELQKRGIEADLIMMHPYDRWGFASMSKEEDAFYWNYAIARFAAYRNVWWSLANEYDLLKAKTIEDWEGYAKIIQEKDPYDHLRSIHHCITPYDNSMEWITHCSMQADPATTDKLREKFQKPVLMDEMRYEGNLPYPWGNASGKEMNHRFWQTICRGGYPGHGETFINMEKVHAGEETAWEAANGAPVIWWSHGGKLQGESWKRLAFVKEILEDAPGHGLVLDKDLYGIILTCTEEEKDFEIKSYYLYYYGDSQLGYADIEVDKDTEYRVEVIDTWNMTITDMGVKKGRFFVELPGTQYMAVRLKKVK